jgi:hypothetical protein
VTERAVTPRRKEYRMSLYQVQQCLLDYIRGSRAQGDRRAHRDRDGRLHPDPGEKAADETGDIATLYQMGVHPVVINTYCRSSGSAATTTARSSRGSRTPAPRRTRWQTS